MTLDDIKRLSSLNTRKIEAFGGEVTIRDLSIKEMREITSMEDDSKILVHMVSHAMVDPKMSIEDIDSLGMTALPHLTKIVNSLNGTE